ncbi:DMT family transporter [Falsirhodobacter sp. alg1]|uniref:DMT family transporter n=1 Tax=Falsirhodobacter sp. alg1 TaxID=1472418 RepID=UPI0005F09CC7|nr:DMT family transporter [Falsirhodobacter sp. alg1]
MTLSSTGRGIAYMVASTFIFALQDTVTRRLALGNDISVVLMIRYWFFALFVVAIAMRAPGGIRRVLRPHFPKIQFVRGLLLISQIFLMTFSFVKLGLVASHSIAVSFPLMVAALSGPVLGEYVGWRRWTAVAVGAVGILVILNPGAGVLSVWSFLPIFGALSFALYALLTRYVAAKDGSAVSFFWAGITGAVVTTALGLHSWEPLSPDAWPYMLTLCCTSVAGHWCVIRAYDYAEASAVQPFSFLQLVWIMGIGVLFIGETLTLNMIIGAAIVVSAGLFTLWRAGRKGEAATPVARP